MAAERDYTRPYLVLPKLVEQPTWGGNYIATAKGWADRPGMHTKIGQSYELFSGSNLSLVTDSLDPAFQGELTDRDAVETPTHPANCIALANLLAADPVQTLGTAHLQERGNKLGLLIKFTQALGNSFQVHLAAAATHPRWVPKPESWYYFEPGLLTLGIKHGTDWGAYQAAVTAVAHGMALLSQQVQSGELPYADAQGHIAALLHTHNPWQYVNFVAPQKDQLIDLSAGGLHHSWEEDPVKAPHGNVLYELQSEALDHVATMRSFDKGKMAADGSLRGLQIDDYFAAIDRSPAANNPSTHTKEPVLTEQTPDHTLHSLLRTPFYALDALLLVSQNSTYTQAPDRFKHLFVRKGSATIQSGGHQVRVHAGHSCFIPAGVGNYSVTAGAAATQILISY